MNLKGPYDLVDSRTRSLMAFHCLATAGGGRWYVRSSRGWRWALKTLKVLIWEEEKALFASVIPDFGSNSYEMTIDCAVQLFRNMNVKHRLLNFVSYYLKNAATFVTLIDVISLDKNYLIIYLNILLHRLFLLTNSLNRADSFFRNWYSLSWSTNPRI